MAFSHEEWCQSILNTKALTDAGKVDFLIIRVLDRFLKRFKEFFS